MAGRPRKPTHLKLVSGTAKSHKKGAPAVSREPAPARWTGNPPAWLSDHARTAWGRVGPMLDAMGVLTVADEAALGSGCEAMADEIAARASLANPLEVPDGEGGFVEVAAPGAVVYMSCSANGWMARARPEMALIADASRRVLAFLVQFGMTPAARSKVQTTDPAKADPIAGYFGG